MILRFYDSKAVIELLVRKNPSLERLQGRHHHLGEVSLLGGGHRHDLWCSSYPFSMAAVDRKWQQKGSGLNTEEGGIVWPPVTVHLERAWSWNPGGDRGKGKERLRQVLSEQGGCGRSLGAGGGYRAGPSSAL